MGDDNNTLNFYRQHDAFGCFSNFSSHSILLKDKYWKTSEHYFQAQKFEGTPYEEQVRATGSPGQAAKLGRSRNLPLRKDWEKVKDNIMRVVLFAKFTQHDDLKKILLSTGDKTLVEHTENDSYWGDGGGPGKGKNKLGFLLMEVRDEIRANENKEEKDKETETKKEEEKSSGDENSGDNEEEEEEIIENENGERIEPNVNHMYEAGAAAEKQNIMTTKKRGKKGGSKTKTKRGVFKDEDGSSKLEKSNDKKGSVTVIGEGTIFSEKALPPQAKFVVNKHQMQRKYHPTEDDFQDEAEDEEPTHAKPAPQRKVMADFFKLKESEEKLVEEDILTPDAVLETAKNHLEIYKQITDPELKSELAENSLKIRNHLSRIIEEFVESGDSRLSTAMEYFQQLE